jgi:hypothetical protein
MTDEQLADMHRLLAEYHRGLAKEAVLDVVQQYHSDLAQRLSDEAALIPRRTAIVERLHEREQQKMKDGEWPLRTRTRASMSICEMARDSRTYAPSSAAPVSRPCRTEGIAHFSTQRAGLASIDKFDAAGIPVPPHHMAVLCRFETVEWQIKFEGGNVKRRWMKPGSLIVEILDQAGVDAANTVKVKQRELINFNALQGSKFDHQEGLAKTFWSKLPRQVT